MPSHAEDQQSNYVALAANKGSSPLTEVKNMFSISTLFAQRTYPVVSVYSCVALSLKVH